MKKTAASIASTVLVKLAEKYDMYGNPIPPGSQVLPTLLGGGMGAGAAHYMFPTIDTKKYRALARKIDPEVVAKSVEAAKSYKGKIPQHLLQMVDDVSHGGKKVKFQAPPHVARRYYLNRALQANAKRLLGGTVLGLLGGYGAHKYYDE